MQQRLYPLWSIQQDEGKAWQQDCWPLSWAQWAVTSKNAQWNEEVIQIVKLKVPVRDKSYIGNIVSPRIIDHPLTWVYHLWFYGSTKPSISDSKGTNKWPTRCLIFRFLYISPLFNPKARHSKSPTDKRVDSNTFELFQLNGYALLYLLSLYESIVGTLGLPNWVKCHMPHLVDKPW